MQELTSPLHQLSLDDQNDYEDVLDAPLPNTTLERQTPSKAVLSGDFYLPPDMPNDTMSQDDSSIPKYSKVNKVKGREEESAEVGRSSSPVIKSHYMSTSVAITEEFNRLTTELENSLKDQC